MDAGQLLPMPRDERHKGSGAGEDPWMDRVRRGDYAGAWAISDAILRERAGRQCWHLPRHEQWVWDGTPLQGARVLVRCYHGLGDTLQFVRYAPHIRAAARSVTTGTAPAAWCCA